MYRDRLYRNWSINPTYSKSLTFLGSVAYFSYILEGTDPDIQPQCQALVEKAPSTFVERGGELDVDYYDLVFCGVGYFPIPMSLPLAYTKSNPKYKSGGCIVRTKNNSCVASKFAGHGMVINISDHHGCNLQLLMFNTMAFASPIIKLLAIVANYICSGDFNYLKTIVPTMDTFAISYGTHFGIEVGITAYEGLWSVRKRQMVSRTMT